MPGLSIRALGRRLNAAPVRTAGARARRWLPPRQTCRVAAQDNSRGLHPGQFAPLGPGPQWGPSRTDQPAGETLASLVLIEPLAHVRGPVPGLSIRAYGRQATLAPVQEDSARARGLHPGQFAPGGGELRSRLYEPLARVRAGGISRAGPPVAKSKKRKGRGKRHWPSLFSLRGIIEEGRTCISRKGAVHFF